MSDIQSRHHSDEIPGKRTCRLLREMRKQLAEANRIPYTPAECTSTAPCTGSCPVCEEELAYLNRELAKKPTKWQIYPTYSIVSPPPMPVPGSGDGSESDDDDELIGFVPIMELLDALAASRQNSTLPSPEGLHIPSEPQPPCITDEPAEQEEL